MLQKLYKIIYLDFSLWTFCIGHPALFTLNKKAFVQNTILFKIDLEKEKL